MSEVSGASAPPGTRVWETWRRLSGGPGGARRPCGRELPGPPRLVALFARKLVRSATFFFFNSPEREAGPPCARLNRGSGGRSGRLSSGRRAAGGAGHRPPEQTTSAAPRAGGEGGARHRSRGKTPRVAPSPRAPAGGAGGLGPKAAPANTAVQSLCVCVSGGDGSVYR